jgi:subtilase family serine protease
MKVLHRSTLNGSQAFVLAAVVIALSLTSVRGASATSANSLHSSAASDVCSTSVAPGHARCLAFVRPASSVSSTSPSDQIGDNGAYSPAYLQSAYNVASLAIGHNNGVGEIVAIVDANSDPTLVNDLAHYRAHFGLSACPSGTVSTANSSCVIEQVNETGGTALPVANSAWALEESIDVDMVSAICPNCQILVVDAQSSSIGDLGTGVNTAVSLGALVVSNSYGLPEYAGEVNDANLYYNHPGVAILAAAGDTGYGVDFPAADPDVIAVGGTSLTQASDTGSRNGHETAWNGTTSGCSLYEPKPSWQLDTGCANRSVADVAAVADPSTGVWIYDSYNQSGLLIAGGTSVATPIVGALFAVANSTFPSTAYPVTDLYANRSALVSVSSGSDGSCGTYLCNAALSQNGYNGPTGLGTPAAMPNSALAFGATTSVVAPSPNVKSSNSASRAALARHRAAVARAKRLARLAKAKAAAELRHPHQR